MALFDVFTVAPTKVSLLLMAPFGFDSFSSQSNYHLLCFDSKKGTQNLLLLLQAKYYVLFLAIIIGSKVSLIFSCSTIAANFIVNFEFAIFPDKIEAVVRLYVHTRSLLSQIHSSLTKFVSQELT